VGNAAFYFLELRVFATGDVGLGARAFARPTDSRALPTVLAPFRLPAAWRSRSCRNGQCGMRDRCGYGTRRQGRGRGLLRDRFGDRDQVEIYAEARGPTATGAPGDPPLREPWHESRR